MKTLPIKTILSGFILLLLSSCGSGSGGTATGNGNTGTSENNNTSGGDSGLSGLITSGKKHPWDYEEPSIVSIRLKNGKALPMMLIANSTISHTNSSGVTAFKESSCGEPDNYVETSRISVVDKNGYITQVTPCNKDLTGFGNYNGYFKEIRLSPDNSKVATSVWHESKYTTIIFKVDTKKEIVRFNGFYSPVWLNNNKILLLADGQENYGIYLTDSSTRNPTRIDNEKVTAQASHADIDTTGKHIIFEYNSQIWTMNLNGSGFKRLFSIGSAPSFPVWSPDSNYVAYLRKNKDYRNVLYFYNIKGDQHHTLSNKSLLSGDGDNGGEPIGPISWTK